MEIVNQTDFHFAPFVGRIGFPGHSLTLIIKGTFDLVPGEAAVTAEEEGLFPTGDELYEDDDEGLGSFRYESDFAYFKPRADLLLVGKCHTPGAKPRTACRVTFKVGAKSRSLAVFGDRYWKRVLGPIAGMTDPEPFTEMDLRYENGFGGPKVKKNPVGKGNEQKGADDGSTIWPLPNIEDPQDLIGSQRSRPEPAGFGPLGRTWDQRSSKLGTYKGKYLEERWPWFPEDFDWGHFNAASAGMQVEGYLKGDEKLYFENLHREHPQYLSQLPGLRARCFLNEPEESSEDRPLFREVLMKLDTLWVDMETEKLVLVWRGVTKVKSEEYEELLHAFIVSENLDGPAESVDYYQALFLKQLAEEEEDFETEEPETGDVEEPIDIDEEIARVEAEVRAALIAGGIDPDAEIPPPSEETKQEEARILKEFGIEEEEEKEPLTREIIQERITRGEGFAEEDLSGIDLSDLDMKGIDFQKAILAGVCFKNSVLCEANLTEADLEMADLSGANLKKADLKEADLTEANLAGADLTGAMLEWAIFEKAKLEGAVLDQVMAKDACFSEANLTGASLKESILSGADLSESIIDRADFRGSELLDTAVDGASGVQVNMEEADLTELRASEECNFTQGSFRKAIGKESIWEKANLKDADFSFSTMEGADFTEASLEKANLSGSDMKGARFQKANLREAKFISMNLFEGSLEKADLTSTDFRGSNLYGVEFLDAIVEKTDFEGANLKMTKLKK
ncbi:DUF2169 domain-containing protein [Thermodesulfobacteriota bacterium]